MNKKIPVYSWFLVNSPLPFIRARPGQWPANFIGANPGQEGAYIPLDINMLEALAMYKPT
jgi:hypothetical protein